MCGVERGVEGTHLPRYYCQSIIQGNARRAPRGRVHYALTTGSVLVSQPPRVIVCLRLRVCVYLCMCLLASQLNAPSSCVWGGVGGCLCVLKLRNILAIHTLDTVPGFATVGVFKFLKTTLSCHIIITIILVSSSVKLIFTSL